MIVRVNWLMLFRSAAGRRFGPIIVPSVHFRAFSILENKLIGYADNSTLMAVCTIPSRESYSCRVLIRDLGRVSEWCDLWGMKLNASKAKTMIFSKSPTPHPQSPPLTIGGTVLKESDDLVILGVTFASKLTFEKHHCFVSRAVLKYLVS